MKNIKTFVFLFIIVFMLSAVFSLFLHYDDINNLEVGFPWTFYQRMQLSGNDFTNYGWSRTGLHRDLMFSGLLALIITAVYHIFLEKKNGTSR